MAKRKLKEYEVFIEEIFLRFPIKVMARNQEEAKRKAIDKRSAKIQKAFNRNPILKKCSMYRIRASIDTGIRVAQSFRNSSDKPNMHNEPK